MITKEDAQLFVKEVYYEGCLGLKRKKNKAKEVLSWIRPLEMRKK